MCSFPGIEQNQLVAEVLGWECVMSERRLVHLTRSLENTALVRAKALVLICSY